MTNLLNFIDIQKYINLHIFFKNNNLPNDIFIYIVDISIPFEKYIINQICESINITNEHGIFFCNNIFDKMTYSKYHSIINENNVNIKYLEYCIVDDVDQYIIMCRCFNQAYNTHHITSDGKFRRKSKYKYRASFYKSIEKLK